MIDNELKSFIVFNIHLIIIGATMARITIEDCLDKVENRFQLVHLAAKRVKQLRNGKDALVKSKNKEIVTALREIAANKITLGKMEEYDSDEF